MTGNILNIIWILFIVFTLLPLFKQRNIAQARLKKIRQIELKRNSRVIAMIHFLLEQFFAGVKESSYPCSMADTVRQPHFNIPC